MTGPDWFMAEAVNITIALYTPPEHSAPRDLIAAALRAAYNRGKDDGASYGYKKGLARAEEIAGMTTTTSAQAARMIHDAIRREREEVK